ncbi:MAG: alanine--glyoxylate aminotransferase family protein [Candidatus Saelkia tenebricola]|nr:alanine--glyoxylate aminotransferase family protein [Candidatus Saelkia tenebricola]
MRVTPRKKYLLTPGPTPVPEEILLTQAEPIIHHRTPEFKKIFTEVSEGLKYVFQTKNPVLVFSSSGTGAMESAVANLKQDGIKFLSVMGGKFGERWTEICKAFGADCEVLEVKWGQSPDTKDIETKLSGDKAIKVILTTLCETSTGSVYDVKAIAKIAKKYDALVVVDAISGLLADEFRMDDWGIDIAIAGSQKGLMLPPGLSFISLSGRAWEYVDKSKPQAYYFNLKKAMSSGEKYDTPWTPAVSLVIGLRKALELIKEEKIENVWKRHNFLAATCRQAIEGLGLKLFAQNPSSAVTSVMMPDSIDSAEFVKFIRNEFGISIAGGQGALKGKIFRIAHLGYMNIFDLLVGIAAIEFALHNFGYKFSLGKGILKLEEEFLKEYKKEI